MVHYLKVPVQLCAQKQRNKRYDVFLEVNNTVKSSRVGHLADTRDLDQPPCILTTYGVPSRHFQCLGVSIYGHTRAPLPLVSAR